MKDCPCGSSKTLADCCALIHQNQQLAIAAEQLMRARYTAFVIGNNDFIIDTYHSSCHAAQERDQIVSAADLKWVKLEIIDASQALSPTTTSTPDQQQTAFVEFKAWYLEDEQLQQMHERSRFVKEDSPDGYCWRYIDGTFPKPSQATCKASGSKKLGRNDPCPCNSGKKYKKCCG